VIQPISCIFSWREDEKALSGSQSRASVTRGISPVILMITSKNIAFVKPHLALGEVYGMYTKYQYDNRITLLSRYRGYPSIINNFCP
jgi:hypothetical protein